MASQAEAFKINLNQNVWGLLLSFAALGAAEYYELRALFILSLIASIAMLISVLVTTLAYTRNYWNNKAT